MSTLSPYYSQLAVATAALGFAHSYTLLALEESEPSRLLLEAAIGDVKTALAYLIYASGVLEEFNRETGTAKAPCCELPRSYRR